MINVFIQNINDISIEAYEKFFLELPKEMKENVEKYLLKEDRQRSLIGKMLLLNYLKKHTYFNLYDIKVTSYNKPYIPNSTISFNISHSGEYVILAATFSNTIGVDIEEMNPNIDINDFKEVLSQDEYNHIQNSQESLKDFYTLWTTKEALLKAEGKGFFDDAKMIKIKKDKIVFKNKEYFILSSSFQNYMISIVFKNKDEISDIPHPSICFQ